MSPGSKKLIRKIPIIDMITSWILRWHWSFMLPEKFIIGAICICSANNKCMQKSVQNSQIY